MTSILSTIQNEICHYAEAISGVTGTDVEIIDEYLIRIAGTGYYKHMLNQNVSRNGYIYRHVLRVQETVLIKDPGENNLCHLCENRENCTEELDLNAPIFLNGKVIGVIGIICSTKQQRAVLLQQLNKFITFIEQIAEMISSKVFECLERLRAQESLHAFRRLIDAMDRGVIAIDSQQKIWHTNLSASRFFNKDIIGLSLSFELTGDILYGDEEAWLELEGQRYHVLCRNVTFTSLENDTLTMIIFQDARDYITHVNQSSVENNEAPSPLIGNSLTMMNLKKTLTKVAVSHANVLITGESGSGKEVVAYALHAQSTRHDQPFVTLNCAAIPEQLLESELFGYIRGAFTGADPKGRIGKFELAHGGSLFLDEIGDMPLLLQAKLLRVLQDKVITRVGSNNQIPTDVRIIAATNKNLLEMVEQKTFREDLYYRLNVVPIQVPALREHREDIADLAKYFSDQFSVQYGREKQKIPEMVMNYLYGYPWPGNIRELRNVIEYIYVMQGDMPEMNHSHLPEYITATSPSTLSIHAITETNKQPEHNYEKERIQRVLEKTGYSIKGKKEAAHLLGLSIATLYRRLKKYDITL